ncbi:hypothetical protein ACVMB0_007591 [Bradyrhizobium sp. USDA 4451]
MITMSRVVLTGDAAHASSCIASMIKSLQAITMRSGRERVSGSHVNS